MKSIQEVDIKKVKPYGKNPRKNDDSVPAVAESLKEFGWRQPIVVDKNMVIIAGHTRYKAAKALKMDKVPVIIADDLTEEQVKAYRLADNKVGEKSLWDMPKLEFELTGIGQIDMGRFGFDTGQLATPDVIKEDDYEPEIPEEAITKTGDIYRLGDHVLMCGDSTSSEEVGRMMDGDKAHMVFTDPPWNVAYGSDDKSKWKKRQIANDDMSAEDFRDFLGKTFGVMRQVMRGGESCTSSCPGRSGAVTC